MQFTKWIYHISKGRLTERISKTSSTKRKCHYNLPDFDELSSLTFVTVIEHSHSQLSKWQLQMEFLLRTSMATIWCNDDGYYHFDLEKRLIARYLHASGYCHRKRIKALIKGRSC